MTINGGGHSPSPTPPKNDFKTLGKVEKGKPPSQKASSRGAQATRDLQYSRRGNSPPRTPPIKHLKSFLGLVGKGSFSPSHYVSLRAAFARSLRLSIEGGTFPPLTPPIMDLKSFLGLVGKGAPFLNMCHSELHLRGVSNSFRGLDITPSRLPRENIKEEISRYARNDRALSPRNVFLRGLLFSLLELHPKT